MATEYDTVTTRTEEVVERRTLGDLMAKLFRDLTDLYRKEGQLLRAEVSDKLTQAIEGVGLLIAAAVVFLVALITLTAAIVAALTPLIGPGWSAFAIGGFFALVGLVLALAGKAALKPSKLAPNRTTEQVRRDAQVAREQVS